MTANSPEPSVSAPLAQLATDALIKTAIAAAPPGTGAALAAAEAVVSAVKGPADSDSVNSSTARPAEDDSSRTTKKKKKQPGLGPRWSFILTRGLAIALVWAFFAFCFDPLLRFGVIYSGQKAAQAKVDVEQLQTVFFRRSFPFVDPKFSINHMAVANRNRVGQNLLEFERLDGDIDGLALLKGHYVVNKATLSGLQWDTKRSDSGQLDDATRQEDSATLDALKEKLKSAGKAWAKDIFDRAKLEYDPRNLESVRLAEELEQQWRTDYDGFDSRIKSVEKQVKDFKLLLAKAKGGKPLEKLDVYQKVALDGSRILQNVQQIQLDLKQLPPKAQRDLKDLDSARKRDQAEIQRKIKDLTLDGDQLSDFLLGPELNFQLKQVLAWLEWSNGRVDEFTRPPKPERFRGEDILFPREINLPKYLVRLVEVEGQGEIANNDLQIKGTIEDISSDPQLLNRPTILRMNGTGEVNVTMKAIIDRTHDVPENTIDLVYERPRQDSLELGDADTLQVKVDAARTEWNVRLRTVGDELTGSIMMVQEPATLTALVAAGKDGEEVQRLQRVAQTACADINRVYASVQITGSMKQPQVSVRTNLGESLARGIQRGIGTELAGERDKLLAELDLKLNEKQASIGQVFGGINTLSSQLTSYQKEMEATNFQSLTPQISTKGFDPGKLFR